MSMPDATPAELMTPSSTTRCSRSTVTPASRASRVPKAPQCVVACRPWRSPALARRSEPVHTEVTCRARAAVGAARFGAGHEPRPREDLEGTGEVEDLDVVENQNAGVPLLHLTLLEERITRQPRRISHKQAGSHSQKGKRRIRGPPLSQEPGLVSR